MRQLQVLQGGSNAFRLTSKSGSDQALSREFLDSGDCWRPSSHAVAKAKVVNYNSSMSACEKAFSWVVD